MTETSGGHGRSAAPLSGTAGPGYPLAGRRAALAALIDVVCVLAFVLAGRRSHDESGALAGIASTAWPFLGALALGWLALHPWRAPLRLWPTAVLLWVVTVAVGLGLRLLSGQGASGAFPLVAAGVLALLLIGWRLIARLMLRRR